MRVYLRAYVLAVVVEALAVAVVRVVVQVTPRFAVLGSSLPLLVIVLVALRWGSGPAATATLAGAGLLATVVLPWTTAWAVDAVGAGEVGMFLVTGLAISVVAGRQRRAYRETAALAASLAVTNEELAEAQRQRDAFLNVASHELRTPLTSVRGYVQLCRRYLEGQLARPAALEAARLAALLVSAERNIDRLVRLEDDLLDVSRIEAGRLLLRRRPLDLASLLRECVDTMRVVWPGRTATLDGVDQPLPVLADPDRIWQVLTNYLTNALTFSSGTVAVRAETQGTMVWVGVADQGPGLSPADQQKVWDRFYSSDRRATQRAFAPSTGLGLSLYISKAIVEQHGGAVGVQSRLGAGALFWLTVPRVSADELPAAGRGAPLDGSEGD
jgi:signal transduction histidine kinase